MLWYEVVAGKFMNVAVTQSIHYNDWQAPRCIKSVFIMNRYSAQASGLHVHTSMACACSTWPRDRSLFMAGGTGFKSGGASKIFSVLESFSGKIFAADAASFVSPHYPYELQLNLHGLHINSTLKYMNFLHQEWASKKFLVKSHLNPVPPRS